MEYNHDNPDGTPYIGEPTPPHDGSGDRFITTLKVMLALGVVTLIAVIAVAGVFPITL